jgi:Holliday junction DNA helicase RuvA
MIGRLAGQIVAISHDQVMIDVRGVGYEVHVSDRTRAALPGIGAHAVLYTDLLVREDLMQLFGFASLAERDWHRALMTVQGIGAKASMAILGVLGADGVARAITLGDTSAIRAAPGVGPKIAQRLVLELKSKAPALMARSTTQMPADAGTSAPADPDAVTEALSPDTQTSNAAPHKPARPAAPAPASASASATAEAMSALTNLGYGPTEAAAAVAQATTQGEADTATLIRAALALLQPRG